MRLLSNVFGLTAIGVKSKGRVASFYTNRGAVHHKKQDYDKAFKAFKRGADMEDSAAQYAVGKMYKLGEGVAQDDDEAIRYLKMADTNEHPKAAYRLGLIYHDIDTSNAIKWYIKSGTDKSKEKLSAMYIKLSGDFIKLLENGMTGDFNITNQRISNTDMTNLTDYLTESPPLPSSERSNLRLR